MGWRKYEAQVEKTEGVVAVADVAEVAEGTRREMWAKNVAGVEREGGGEGRRQRRGAERYATALRGGYR